MHLLYVLSNAKDCIIHVYGSWYKKNICICSMSYQMQKIVLFNCCPMKPCFGNCFTFKNKKLQPSLNILGEFTSPTSIPKLQSISALCKCDDVCTTHADPSVHLRTTLYPILTLDMFICFAFCCFFLKNFIISGMMIEEKVCRYNSVLGF